MEDIMKNPIITKNKVQVDISDETTKFVFKLGAAACVLIGVWAFTCLIAGVVSVGPLQRARGYITAITGF